MPSSPATTRAGPGRPSPPGSPTPTRTHRPARPARTAAPRRAACTRIPEMIFSFFISSIRSPFLGSCLPDWLHSVLEDGMSSNGVTRPAAPSGISKPEKKMNSGTQCPNSQSLSSGPQAQKQNGLWITEAKRDAKRMSAKEVTINVTESIRQMDRSKRITKNCIN